ncbi:hypothetical protein A4H97_22255 [Niastella yeongjuensis]|uniref:Uncharacterized protein n=1 Tax=Niastella yeongjuensis TaxID=354355 RepID=A0A1V9F733_9BACT|nr:hypothetical protein [Niastella yeongjuensis]OQP54223.1 hypothetical protein A4H97_22255 [Niastella yeongjuensis]SEP31708.1 ADP-heptose:LPS heptosyltransferase [Niastella yeongjuensis]
MFDVILQCNNNSNSRDAKNVLIIYHLENKIFIGDTYILINKLASLHAFFNKAAIDINCTNEKHTVLCSTLLKNNPYIRKLINNSWEDLDFRSYDMVFCISRNESQILEMMEQQYKQMPQLPWTTAVYSMSVQLLNWGPNPVISSIFPSFRDMLDDQSAYNPATLSELYIGQEEKEWANQWLRDNGLKEHERLYIVLDSTSERYKLMNMDTYHTVLSHLLKEESAKVLLFDEQGIGKKSFYYEWLGEEQASKLICSVKLSLREALSLLSSDYTKLIFGPCTGLIHCASGIYNHFIRQGKPAESMPAIITYTGRYADGHTAEFWWGTSPLVTCIIVRTTTANEKEAVLLSDLPEEERKDTSRLLWCNEYTPDMLINYLPAHSHSLVI